MSDKIKSHNTGFYVKIWVVLVVMLGVSIAIGQMGHVILATTLIFMIATIKAYLVMAFYMGLASEARYVTWVLISGLVIVIILFFGIMPDVLYG